MVGNGQEVGRRKLTGESIWLGVKRKMFGCSVVWPRYEYQEAVGQRESMNKD